MWQTFSTSIGDKTFTGQVFGRRIYVANVSINPVACTPPGAPLLTASPTTITSGGSSTLSAINCSGTVTWSNGLGTGSNKTVSPTSTTTYTANGCTSGNGSVTVPVNGGGNGGCSFAEGQYLATFNTTGEMIYAHYCGTKLYATTSSGVGGLYKPRSWIQAIGYAQFACFEQDNPRPNCSGGGGCTPPGTPSLTASPTTINSGGSSTISVTNCSGTVTWSNGLGTGSSVAVSPTSTTTYTATCSVNGCTSGNGSATVTVNQPTGGGGNCVALGNQCSGNPSEVKNYTINQASGGNKPITLTYRGHDMAGTLRMTINGTLHIVSLPQTTLAYQNFTLPNSYPFNAGNNIISLASGGGYLCFQELYTSGSSGGGTPPGTPSLTASPTTINSGGSSTISVTNCSGTVTWSNGLARVVAWPSAQPARRPTRPPARSTAARAATAV